MRMMIVLMAVTAFCVSAGRAMAEERYAVSELAMRSGGEAVEDGWRMRESGFVGSYVRLVEAGEVRVRLEGSGFGVQDSGGEGIAVVVGDERVEFEVSAEAREFEHVFELPAATHFVRIEYRDEEGSADRGVVIRGVTFSGSDVEVLNEHSDGNALAAAETYINTGRRGRATLTLPGVAEGTAVRVKLKRHAFNFGVVASGVMQNRYFFDDPEEGSDAWRVQRFMSEHFNAVVPGNAGKWAHNEEQRGVVTMELADAIARFAERHNMRMRMHTLLWDTGQQPSWVTELLEKALEGDEAAKAELRRAVGERMEYYLVERGHRYIEIDGLNEHYHEPRWWLAFGDEGIAEIYGAAAEAVRRGGGTAGIFTNEYNVLQWSQHPIERPGGGSDPYANWYRDYVERLVRAGGEVGGIGVQYYVLHAPGTREGNPHSPARIMGAFQNLSVTGLPISLTEFGVQRQGATKYDAADFLEATARMTFGTAGMNAFMLWGFWEKEMWDQANRGALVDADWNLLPAGRRWLGLMAEWDTDVTVFAGAEGRVDFVGFYGDYEVMAVDEVRAFTLEKGRGEYTVETPAR
jgi:GH35 family endo-1,4-beta-xylanase